MGMEDIYGSYRRANKQVEEKNDPIVYSGKQKKEALS